MTSSHEYAAVEGLKELISEAKVTSGGLLVSLDPEKVGLACAGRGWSLTELANRAGVSYPTLSAIMRRARVRPQTAFKISDTLRRFGPLGAFPFPDDPS